MSIFVAPQSSVHLCKVPLEDNYKHQIQFSTVTAQKNYFNRSAVLKHTIDENTYIRENGSMVVGLPKDKIQTCNYLWYENTGFNSDGQNTSKIYYCFITNIEYVSENSTRITYKTDCYQTWLFQINYNRSFIEREHVADDTPGLHTIPEGLETGEYIVNSTIYDNTFGVSGDNLCYILASTTSWRTKVDPQSDPVKQDPNGGGRYNGIYSGCKYYRFDVIDQVSGRIGIKDALIQMESIGQIENVVGIFIAPKFLAPYKNPNDIEGSNHEVAEVLLPSTSGRIIGNFTNLNGYVPNNKKLLCWPYNYLELSNGNGAHAVYRYEDFNSNGQNGLENANVVDFQVDGVLCPGCSGIIAPRNYKGISVNYEEGIPLGKYPVASFQTDMYTNWLTQNSINIAGIGRITSDDLSIISSGIGALSGATMATVGAVSGNPMLLAGGLSSATGGIIGITNSLIQAEKHELIPPQSTANNIGDVVTSLGKNTPQYYKKSIKAEYAYMLDNYMQCFGYKVNVNKTPNITGRRNWNYVKTIGCNFDGDIPNEDLAVIRQAFDNGITLWHSPDNIYNYSLANDIV